MLYKDNVILYKLYTLVYSRCSQTSELWCFFHYLLFLQAFKGTHFYAFGDYGGIIVAVRQLKLTGELLYVCIACVSTVTSHTTC